MIRTALSLRRRAVTSLALLLTCAASLRPDMDRRRGWRLVELRAELELAAGEWSRHYRPVQQCRGDHHEPEPRKPLSAQLPSTRRGQDITVNGNPLEFHSSAYLQSISAPLTVNAPIVIVGSLQSYASPANTTINGAISGSGNFNAGSGITTLTGAGTWSGSTNVSATLRIAAPNALPSAASVSLSGLLEFASPTAVSYSGTMNSGGTLQQSEPELQPLQQFMEHHLHQRHRGGRHLANYGRNLSAGELWKRRHRAEQGRFESRLRQRSAAGHCHGAGRRSRTDSNARRTKLRGGQCAKRRPAPDDRQ